MTSRFFLIPRNFETLSQPAFPLILLALLCASPVHASEELSRTRFLMGTTCEITADLDAGTLGLAFDEIERVERLLSTWRADTELSALNAGSGLGSRDVSEELFALLDQTRDWSRRTGGAFNSLVGPLAEAWKIRGPGRLPETIEIEDALAKTRTDNVTFDRATHSIALREGSAFEEGAFGKGYAIDRAIRILEEAGCGRYEIDFGGQLAIRSDEPIEVLIANPASRHEGALRISVRHSSVATTSGSEKWFDTPAGTFSHVIDPRTGRALPPRGSATVLHESALVADILSTALYVMGPDEGVRFADANGIAVIYIVPDGSTWSVLTSQTGTNPGLGLTTVSADFRLKGNSK